MRAPQTQTVEPENFSRPNGSPSYRLRRGKGVAGSNGVSPTLRRATRVVGCTLAFHTVDGNGSRRALVIASLRSRRPFLGQPGSVEEGLEVGVLQIEVRVSR